MNYIFRKTWLVVILSTLFAGCFESSDFQNVELTDKKFEINKSNFPKLPSSKTLENDIELYEVRLNNKDESSDIRIYLPKQKGNKKIPVVLVTAAGSYLWNGTSLDKGDQPEHLPYVKNGYAVVAYETPGSLDDVDLNEISDEKLLIAMNDFKNSKAGLIQQQNALNYVLENLISLDTERIYVAGHSSAATHALIVAANEPRVKAAIAYAPAVDFEKKVANDVEFESQYIKGHKDFVTQYSPKNIFHKISVPVFIFHAKDDSVVSIEVTKQFVSELKQQNRNITFVEADTSGHYESMIKEGIPNAIKWLNEISSVNEK